MEAPSIRPYVLAWKLHGRRVVVVGGGGTGTAKVETLLGTGARLVVVDPSPSPRMRDLDRAGTLTWHRRRFRGIDLRGAALVVAATNDPALNRRVRRWARVFGVVVNAVDDPANCDVTVPSVIHRGPATIAVTTNGTSPAAARFLREELTTAINTLVPEATGSLIGEAGQARHQLRTSGSYRYDYHAWRQRFFEPGLDAVRRDRPAELGYIRRRFVAEFGHNVAPRRAGRVMLVSVGRGGDRCLTKSAVASLQQADVVVYDQQAGEHVLACAPPAAERIPVPKGETTDSPSGEITDLLERKARAGNNVVRLTCDAGLAVDSC